MIKILAIAGSTRKESYNAKLLSNAVEFINAQNVGVQAQIVNLNDYTLPLYDGDLEEKEGLPANVIKLKKLFMEHHGLLFALPEYNSSMSPVFKNVIDWVSRPHIGEKTLGCFTGKVAALLSASPGKLGGIRGLIPVRSLLENINVIVIPNQFCLGAANEAFNQEGKLISEQNIKMTNAVCTKLMEITKKLNTPT